MKVRIILTSVKPSGSPRGQSEQPDKARAGDVDPCEGECAENQPADVISDRRGHSVPEAETDDQGADSECR